VTGGARVSDGLVPWAQPLRHLDLLAQFGECGLRYKPRQLPVVDAAKVSSLKSQWAEILVSQA